MAGYVKLLRTIWDDPDFTALDDTVQRLYLLLISQPDITAVGVLPLTAGRWGRLAPNTQPVDIRRNLEVLASANFVLLDNDTEEVMVRTYMAHDGLYLSPNGTKALLKALDKVLSDTLRDAVSRTIATLTGGGSEAPSEAPSQGDASPQQPAASSQEPTTSSQQPRIEPVNNSDLTPAVVDAAAAAIEILIEHKIRTEKPRMVGPYRASLLRKLPAEHEPALRAYLAEHPDATAEQLAGAVLGVPGMIAMHDSTPTWHFDPTCPDHDDHGLERIDDHGQGTYAPCHCRSTDPYPTPLATVTSIHRPAPTDQEPTSA